MEPLRETSFGFKVFGKCCDLTVKQAACNRQKDKAAFAAISG